MQTNHPKMSDINTNLFQKGQFLCVLQVFSIMLKDVYIVFSKNSLSECILGSLYFVTNRKQNF